MIRVLFLAIFLTGATTLTSMQFTHALFSDTATSTNNIFTAADVFPPGPGDIVINEIMWPGSFNTNDEWIELRNTTSNPITITGWKIDALGLGSASITLPEATISANGFFLIANFNENSPSSILNIAPDVEDSSVSLANEGEQLVLKDSLDNVIDTANVAPNWFSGTDTPPRKSMERKDPPGDGTSAANWHTSNGSTNLDLSATESATPRTINSLGL